MWKWWWSDDKPREPEQPAYENQIPRKRPSVEAAGPTHDASEPPTKKQESGRGSHNEEELPSVIEVSGVTWDGKPSTKNGMYHLTAERWPPGDAGRPVWRMREDTRKDGKFWLIYGDALGLGWMIDIDLKDTNACFAISYGLVADPTKSEKWQVLDKKADGSGTFWNDKMDIVVKAVGAARRRLLKSEL